MKRRLWLRAAVTLVLALCACFLLFALHGSVLSLLCSATVKTAQTFLPTAALTRAPTQPDADPATTAPPTETARNEPSAASSKSPNAGFTKTPGDIQARMDAAKAAAKSDVPGGKIIARTYEDDGATDRIGSVRVKNTNATKPDLKALLNRPADLAVNRAQPTVLIFHTHTTETYQLLDRAFYSKDFATRSNDSGQNMVRVGDAICESLEKAGYRVLHDTQIHDAKYNGAYERSRAAVQKYLKQYPSLQITLDIHRDAIQLKDGTKIKPVAEIQGKKAAQVMIISGCQEDGNKVTDFPDWSQNLTFALQLQQQMETDFPGLTRPLFFCGRRYNMHLTHCSLLIEVGSDANTLEEAVFSGACIGTSLAHLMKTYETEDTK